MRLTKFQLIGVHLACWLVFFSLPLSFIFNQQGQNQSVQFFAHPAFWLMLLLYPASFYLQVYLFIPQWLFGRKFLLYLVATLAIILLVIWLKPFDQLITNATAMQRPFPEPGSPPFLPEPRMPQPRNSPAVDIVSIFLMIVTIAAALALKLAGRWRQSEQKAALSEAGRAKAELSYLKAQIHPHFLFNTLNNIYSLAQTNNSATADAIFKLSNMMRYLTDEAGEESVALNDELQCIRDYIDLQKLRLSPATTLSVDIVNPEEAFRITPLLLMPFIENVFKHGISNHQPGQISIQIWVRKNRLFLITQNPKLAIVVKEGRTGIGIKNSQERLQQLYAYRHSLQISDNANAFIAELWIDL